MQEHLNSMNNKIVSRVSRADGSSETAEHTNTRVNDGVNWQSDHMFSSGGIAPIRNLAVSDSDFTPSSTDTNLQGELASDGLSRQTSTLSQTPDQSLSSLSAVWQYSGSNSTTVETAALAHDATDTDASTDTHFVMVDISPSVNLDSNDTLELEWGIDI